MLPTLKFDPNYLSDHARRHKGDFGATSETDYESLARVFLTANLPGAPVQCRACPECSCVVYGRIHVCLINGDTIRFDTLTSEFAILGANGFIRTYYKLTIAMAGSMPLIKHFHFRCKPKT